jgi:hypothetical protein
MMGECAEAGDCPDPVDGQCQTVSCVAATCDVESQPAGEATTSQLAGDCKETQCDGSGGVLVVNVDDPFDDGKQCTEDTCSAGVPANTAKAAGVKCSEGIGNFCDGAGACVECLQAAHCPGQICQQNTCIPASCADGVENGTETDLDCGGSCTRCNDGLTCEGDADCKSKVCEGGLCKAPNCTDDSQNGAETDVDCGGFCPACGTGEGCAVGTDCSSHVCTGGICQAPKCVDAVKNGSETDVDCGGSQCPDCADGKKCLTGSDCQGGACAGGLCCTPQSLAMTCAGEKCGTVVNNCGQSVNCGGCTAPETCQQNQCVCTPEAATVTCQGKCGNQLNNCNQTVACTPCASCSDAIKNGAETDVDCGGTCPGCAACAACAVDADCATGLTCSAAVCGPCGAPDAGTD